MRTRMASNFPYHGRNSRQRLNLLDSFDKLDFKTVNEISRLLILNSLNNWKVLSSELKFSNQDIQLLDATASRQDNNPCEQMLQDWYQKYGSEATLAWLRCALVTIERRDAVEKLDEVLESKFKFSVTVQKFTGNHEEIEVAANLDNTLEQTSIQEELRNIGIKKDEIIFETEDINWSTPAEQCVGMPIRLKHMSQMQLGYIGQPENDLAEHVRPFIQESQQSLFNQAQHRIQSLNFPTKDFSTNESTCMKVPVEDADPSTACTTDNNVPQTSCSPPKSGFSSQIKSNKPEYTTHRETVAARDEQNDLDNARQLGSNRSNLEHVNVDPRLDDMGSRPETVGSSVLTQFDNISIDSQNSIELENEYISVVPGWHPHLANRGTEVYRVMQPYLGQDGFYILRPLEDNKKAVTVTHQGNLKHFKIHMRIYEDNRSPYFYFYREGHHAPNIQDLIKFYSENDLKPPNSVDAARHVRLRSPVHPVSEDRIG